MTRLQIEGVVAPEAGQIFVTVEGLLSVLNAGVLELGPIGELEDQPVGDRLLLTADHFDYLGAGARIESSGGYGIVATAQGSGSNRFELRDHYSGESAFSFQAPNGGDVEILVAAGELDVSSSGLLVTLESGTVRMEVAAGTWIGGAQPVYVNGGAEAHLVLAGELRNAAGTSQLGEGDSELELRQGYGVAGVVDAMAGSNRLVWGGSGEAGFDLSEIGDKYLHFQTFEKRGTSTWTLAGMAEEPLGITVREGTLLLAGRLAADDVTTVSSGARLGGTGHFGDIELWGTLAPGVGLGTLYGREVIFEDESLLEIEVAEAGGDRLQLGSAGLEGGSVLVVPRGVPDAGRLTPYVFLETEDELGPENRFVGVSSASTRFTAELSYGATSVAVTLTPTGKRFADFARNPAEAAIAERLDALGQAAPLYPALATMTDSELEDMLAQLAGSELAAGNQLVAASGDLMGPAALGRVQQAGLPLTSAAPLGYATSRSLFDAQPVSLWGRVVTSLGDNAGARTGTTMVLAGLDSLVEADWSYGALLGFGGSVMQSADARSEAASLSAALYGARPIGPLDVRFVAGGTLSAVQTRREVSGPGVDEVYRASYPAFGLHLLAELAVPLQLGPLSAELFADAGYSAVGSAEHVESGGPAALSVSAGWSQAMDVAAGLRVSHATALGTTLARLDGSLALTQRFASGATVLHSFAGSAPFEVSVGEAEGAGLVTGLNLHLDLEKTGLVDLGYAFTWRAASQTHLLSARFVRPI